MASSPSDDALYGSEKVKGKGRKKETPLSPMSESTGPEELEGETPEEREKRLAGMKEELEKVESEISMLRQVLGSKVRHATELKRKLGITPFQEFKQDIASGFNHIKSSDSYVNASESLQSLNDKISNSEAYQKTSAVMKTAGEKTSSVMSSMSAGLTKKMGDLKNSQTFKSLDERVHTTYNTVKNAVLESASIHGLISPATQRRAAAQAKVTGSRSSQDIDDAFREAQIADDDVVSNPGATDVAPADEKVPL